MYGPTQSGPPSRLDLPHIRRSGEAGGFLHSQHRRYICFDRDLCRRLGSIELSIVFGVAFFVRFASRRLTLLVCSCRPSRLSLDWFALPRMSTRRKTSSKQRKTRKHYPMKAKPMRPRPKCTCCCNIWFVRLVNSVQDRLISLEDQVDRLASETPRRQEQRVVYRNALPSGCVQVTDDLT